MSTFSLKTMFVGAFLLLAPVLALSPSSVAAQSVLNPQCERYNNAPDDEKPAVCREDDETKDDDTDDGSVVDLVLEVVNILLLGIGIVATIMLIVGGLKYVTSTGDPNKTNSARNTIIYALVGVVVAVFARAIVLFVLDRL